MVRFSEVAEEFSGGSLSFHIRFRGFRRIQQQDEKFLSGLWGHLADNISYILLVGVLGFHFLQFDLLWWVNNNFFTYIGSSINVGYRKFLLRNCSPRLARSGPDYAHKAAFDFARVSCACL